ncbi:WYL domain-containing protein [Zhihengliuella sp.]|uniref:helix-turn-helix transcriptional regulator n=1 Tax=Zhihengliuella sp. TaxID=1954483 RepID=UPI002811703D|nr:WYL domain-containing protein [Zhihengliuella sp.]
MAEQNVDNSERLLSLLSTLLQTRVGLTKQQIRAAVDGYAHLSDENFEASFERDKAHLRELGVPLDSPQDADRLGQGTDSLRYRVDPAAYRLPEIEFAADEVLALSLAARLWRDPALGSAALRAFSRITGNAPAARGLLRGRRTVAQPAESAASGPEGAPGFVPASTEDAASPFGVQIAAEEVLFGPLATAAQERRVVAFRYRTVDGVEGDRTVSVWGLGSRFGHWYLIGHDHDRDAERVFRLSRIIGGITELRPEQCAVQPRPAGFTATGALAHLDPAAAMTTAVVRLAPGRGANLRRRAVDPGALLDGALQDGAMPSPAPPSPTGREDGANAPGDVIAFDYHDGEAASAEIAALGSAAEVLAPEELRAAVVRRLERTLAAQRRPAPHPALKERRHAGRAPATAVAARALDLVAYVRQAGAPTVAEAVEHFGVPRRTLRKDIERLQLCGPGSWDYGSRVDIWIDDETDTIVLSQDDGLAQPIRLNFAEAFALGTGLQLLSTVPAASAEAAGRALGKLRGATEHLDGLFDLVAPRSRAADDAGLSGLLAAAVEERRVVRLRYVSTAREEITERLVEPVQLEETGDRAYLHAWCRRAGDSRRFRLDRIVEAEPLDEMYTPGERHAVDPEHYTPRKDDLVAVLGFAPRLAPLQQEFSPLRTGTLPGDERTFCEVRIADPGTLRRMVAEHGGDLTVVAPEGLTRSVTAWLEEALRVYTGSAAATGQPTDSTGSAAGPAADEGVRT